MCVACSDATVGILKSEALSKVLESVFHISASSGFSTFSAFAFFFYFQKRVKCGKEVCGKGCQQKL